MVDDDGWRTVFQGAIFSVEQTVVRSGDTEALFERASCSDVVRVYPIEQERIILIREARLDLRKSRVLRVVSGSIEDGETPLEAARRELQEEASITCDDLVIFHESRPMLKVEHKVYHVLARGCKPFPQGKPEALEDIIPLTVPLREVPSLVMSGGVEEDVIAFALLRLCQELGVPTLNVGEPCERES